MKVEINCTGSDTIQLHELTEFQGELKERSAGDVEKIIKSIKKHGFSFPFFVWKNDGKNNVLDGHGRLMALQQMAAAGGAFYIWYASRESVNFENALKENGLTVKQQLIWVKNAMTLGRQDWQWRHEPCLYGWKNGANHYWDGRRDLTTVYDEKPNYKKMNKEQLLQEITKLRGDNVPNTIIYEDKPARNEEHPTMKPVKLFQRLIKNSSKEDDAILDPFGDSGTTIIACEKLNRTAYVMELDPRYCDVIRRRWTQWAAENDVDAGSGALD